MNVDVALVDQQARAALSGTKDLYAAIRVAHEARALPQEQELASWRRTVSQANAAISTLLKVLSLQKRQFETERDVLLEEMRAELVDREAHAARTAERYRIFADRESSGLNEPSCLSAVAYDRALHSARQIDLALAGLKTTAQFAGPGCSALEKEARNV